jgi:hypothetical protein
MPSTSEEKALKRELAKKIPLRIRHEQAFTAGKYKGKAAEGVEDSFNLKTALAGESDRQRLEQQTDLMKSGYATITVEKYEGDTARYMGFGLANVAYENPDDFERAAYLMGDDETVKALKGCKNSEVVADLIKTAVENPKSFFREVKISEAIGKYTGEAFKRIKDKIKSTKKEEKVNKIIELFKDDKTAEIIGNYESDVVGPITWLLTGIAEEKPELFFETVDTIGNYKGGAALKMIANLADIGDKGEFHRATKKLRSDKAVKAVGRYEGEIASKVASELGSAARLWPEKFDTIAELMSDDKTASSIGQYKGAAAKFVTTEFLEIAKDKPEKFDNVTRLFKSKKAVELIEMCEKDVLTELVPCLTRVASEVPEFFDETLETMEDHFSEKVISEISYAAKRGKEELREALESIKKRKKT